MTYQRRELARIRLAVKSGATQTHDRLSMKSALLFYAATGPEVFRTEWGFIQMFVKVATPIVGEEEAEGLREVLFSGNYVSGKKVAEFEKRFADYVGVEHAVAVNSGTGAIHAALAAIDLQPGDEVICPSLTFFSTITGVIHAGGVPVLADITSDDYCLDASDLERCLTPRTKAIMPVHYFGHCADMDAINAFAQKHGLNVIEDCAQSHGTTYKGKMTGAIGDMGAFSFFATKHMTTGEGGIVTLNDADQADFMRKFRSHGMTGRHDHGILGYNYRMQEFSAAIGLAQLPRLDGFNENRIRVSQKLIEKIRDIDWLTVPQVPQHIKHTYFWLHIQVDEEKLGIDTQELIQVLADKGVQTRNRYLEPLYKQPILTTHIPPILKLLAGEHLPDYGNLNLPNVEKIAGKVLGLPNRPDMTDEEIDYVSEVLHSLKG